MRSRRSIIIIIGILDFSKNKIENFIGVEEEEEEEEEAIIINTRLG
jgi:hypothetical protein